MKIKQGREKSFLGVGDSDIVFWRRFTMDFQDHTLSLHGSKDRIEGLIVHDTRGGISGDASWIAFDTRDAGGFRCLDGCM